MLCAQSVPRVIITQSTDAKHPGSDVFKSAMTGSPGDTMTDPGVQAVREWLRRQPYSLRMLTLLLFLEETVEEQFGKETMSSFDGDLKEAFRRLPSLKGQEN